MEDHSAQGLASTFDSIPIKTLLIFLSVAGLCLVLVSTHRYGIGISQDSTNYLASARSLLRSGGFQNHGGGPYLLWPPLYPALLALLSTTGIPVLEIVRLVNAVLLALIIYCSALLFSLFLSTRLFLLLATLSVLLSMPILETSVMMWSEPLFILLSVLFLLRLASGNRFTFGSVLLLSLVAGAACLTRYAGITLVASVTIALLFFGRSKTLRSRMAYSAVFFLLSLTPLVIWLFRNFTISGTLAGAMPPSNRGFLDNCFLLISVLSNWFLPLVVPVAIRGLLSAATFIIISILVWRYGSSRYWKGDLSVVVLYIAIYTLFLLESATIRQFEPLNHRYVSPIYIPIFLLVFAGMERVWKNQNAGTGLRFALVLVSILWFVFPVTRVGKNVLLFARHGAGGYSTDQWKESRLTLWLESNISPGPLYSNDTSAVYALTGFTSRAGIRRDISLRELQHQIASDKSYLIYFQPFDRTQFFSAEELKALIQIDELVSFPEGSVYRIR